VTFFATGGAVFTAAAALFAAHRFFKAATMFALPALLSFLLGFEGAFVAGAGGSSSLRTLGHRSCCASFIRLRAAAENFRRLIMGVSGVAAGSVEAPESMGLCAAVSTAMPNPSRAVVSFFDATISPTTYTEAGDAVPVALAPVRAVALAGELIEAAVPKLGNATAKSVVTRAAVETKPTKRRGGDPRAQKRRQRDKDG
jgi:hypothetical protein